LDEAAEETAVSLLLGAATGPRLAALPAASRPQSVAEAHAIQDRLVARTGKDVAGYKVATDATGSSMYGAIFAEDCFPSDSTIEPGRYSLLGIEGEIAFRLTADLPQQTIPYTREEIAAIVVPFPAIEIVDSRFLNYEHTPPLERLADRMSNGGMVLADSGTVSAPDFTAVRVMLRRDGETLLNRLGGHARGDPLLPVLEFIGAEQGRRDFRAGQFITAGTFTGLLFATPGQSFTVKFEGFGEVSIKLGR
jgi:2-keto-4-pentenoate hydratase